MVKKLKNIWDFKSYDEKTWFRNLVYMISILSLLYVGLHWWLNDGCYSYQYNKLNQDQAQFISRICMDPAKPEKSDGVGAGAGSSASQKGTASTGGMGAKVPAVAGTNRPAPAGANGATPANTSHPGAVGVNGVAAAGANVAAGVGANGVAAGANGGTQAGTNSASPVVTADSPLPPAVTKVVADYINQIFDKSVDAKQLVEVRDFIGRVKPQAAVTYLNGTLFKVHSYFWLIGPAVYGEVIFCALFGVFCNLLFVLGAVGSNSTTDLANPATQFDSSEILGQVAKIIYAPICTLFVVLGYSLMQGQNIVDISFGKGLLIFGFVGGYYSSRVISLMDRLKDVLLPNSGTAALAAGNQPVVIQQVKVALALGPGTAAAVATAAAGPALNPASVQMTLAGGTTPITGAHIAGDPDGVFTFSAVTAGTYTISASLTVTPAGGPVVTLAGNKSGQILSGTAPIQLLI